MCDVAEQFDVMKWKGQWDKATRRVIEERLAQHPAQSFFDEGEVSMLTRLVAALLPDIADDIPIVEILGSSLVVGEKKGVRMVDVPWRPEMYKRGLAFLEEEARRRFGAGVTAGATHT